jgi:hypothetical protein
LNRGDYKSHETEIYNWLVKDRHRHVNIVVKLHYDPRIDGGRRPWLITYHTQYFQRGRQVDDIKKKFYNVHKSEADAISALCRLGS